MEKRNTVLTVLALFIIVIGYLCWPVKKIETPESAVALDMTKTQNQESYLSEEDYERQMEEIVKPYLQQYEMSGYFNGYDGSQLYYEQYRIPDEKAHIVICHGFTDGIFKYDEMIYYFLNNGYSVSIMEHRSHGYSYRALEDLCKVTVEAFDEYMDDYKIFVEQIVRPTMTAEEKLFVYAHSMGGGIAACLMEEDSTLFDAAVLSSPMMEILYGGVPNHVAGLITNVSCLIGRGEEYIVGSGSFEDTYDFVHSSANSEARYAYIQKEKIADRYYQTNGGTYKWLKAAKKATEEIRENASAFRTPALLFQAGNDTTVGKNGQNEFVRKAQDVQMIQIADVKHSIFLAGNDILIPYMNTILEFFNSHI